MGSLPFAFSVHHFINSVGADAGFAAIIGLAILILLYFAQARETSNLRNHAYDAAQRIQDLEARLAQVGRAQPAQAQGQPGQAQPAQAQAQPAGAPGQSQQPAVRPAAVGAAVASATPAPAPAAAFPVAPAGVAAPALTAATRLIPTPVPVAVATAAPPDATVIGATPAPTIAPPATVAGGANGSAQDQVTPPPRPVAAPAGTGTPPPRIQIRPPAMPPPPRRQAARQRQRRAFSGGRILLALAGVLALGGVVALLLVLTSNNGNSTASTSRVQTTNAPGVKKRARGTAVTPSSVTVAVLNGTATSGLAHRVAVKLGGVGYKQGTVATATDQTKTATTVSYLPGFRRDAVAVASSLKLSPSAVAPVDQPTQAVACPQPNPCSANVVVTVGSDLANTQ